MPTAARPGLGGSSPWGGRRGTRTRGRGGGEVRLRHSVRAGRGEVGRLLRAGVRPEAPLHRRERSVRRNGDRRDDLGLRLQRARPLQPPRRLPRERPGSATRRRGDSPRYRGRARRLQFGARGRVDGGRRAEDETLGPDGGLRAGPRRGARRDRRRGARLISSALRDRRAQRGDRDRRPSLVLARLEKASIPITSLSLLRMVSIGPIITSTGLLLGLNKPFW